MSTPRNSVFTVLRHPTFALILSAAAISNIGNWMEGVAQAWAVVEQTKGDPTTSAFLTELLSVADFAPVLFLALLAGVISDRSTIDRLFTLTAPERGSWVADHGRAGYINALIETPE